MVKLHSILGNSIKLDGGASFGNAPRRLWERWAPPDRWNRIQLATRALLAITEKHRVLFEAGVGAFLGPKYRERFGVEESEHVLLESLASAGLTHRDVTEVILSHLHFDHAGGLLSAWQDGKDPELLLPNAEFLVSERAWERATHPHHRDRASFSPVINQALVRSSRLVQLKGDETLSFDELEVQFFESDGHSPGMLCSDLRWSGGRMLFGADLIPGRFWVHLPITMGYDRCAELLVDEKEAVLSSLAEEDAWIFYAHDPEMAVSKVEYDATGNTAIAVGSHPDLREVFHPTTGMAVCDNEER